MLTAQLAQTLDRSELSRRVREFCLRSGVFEVRTRVLQRFFRADDVYFNGCHGVDSWLSVLRVRRLCECYRLGSKYARAAPASLHTPTFTGSSWPFRRLRRSYRPCRTPAPADDRTRLRRSS